MQPKKFALHCSHSIPPWSPCTSATGAANAAETSNNTRQRLRIMFVGSAVQNGYVSILNSPCNGRNPGRVHFYTPSSPLAVHWAECLHVSKINTSVSSLLQLYFLKFGHVWSMLVKCGTHILLKTLKKTWKSSKICIEALYKAMWLGLCFTPLHLWSTTSCCL